MKPAIKALGIAFLWVAFGALAAMAQPYMPDTGQTTCYDTDGNVIDCQGTGQDGEFSINPHSYTKLGSGGQELDDSATDWLMVRDNVTGLIWERKGESDGTEDFTNPNDPDNGYTWYDSNPATNGGDAGTPGDGTDIEDFIGAMNSLNGVGYGGYSDWRLPTVKELSSLRDLERYIPAIDTEYFPNTVSGRYWSSSSDARYPSGAWGVYFYNGSVGSSGKSSSDRVRAVRGGQ